MPAYYRFVFLGIFVVAALASREALLAPDMQTVFAAQYPAEYTSAIPGQTAGYVLCRYQGLRNGHPVAYVTPMFSTGAPERTATVAFVHYIEATYDVSTLQQGNGYCKTVSNSADQRTYTMSLIEKQWAASHTEVIRVAWTDSPGQPAAYTAAATPNAVPMQAPTASSSTGLYVFCSSEPDGPIVYFSDFFVADPDPGGPRGVSFRNVSSAYFAFLKQKYAFNSGSNYPTGCLNATRTDAGMRYAQTHKQQMEDQYRKTGKQIVETGWRYTAAPGTSAPASATPARLHH